MQLGTRFDPEEFLDLRVQLPDGRDIAQIQKQIKDGRGPISLPLEKQH